MAPRVAACPPFAADVDIAKSKPAMKGDTVADAPVVSARVERSLYDAARTAAGLPADATQGQVVRYALAALAGHPDPRATAIVPVGVHHVRRVAGLART
jgi:hypothetical protein